MKKRKPVQRQAVLRQMLELAEGSANDAVKLAFLGEDEREIIDSLDLGCLTEFRRSGNGAVEIRLVDRASVLAKLLEQLGGEDAGAAAFLRALDQGPPAREG